MPARWSGHRAVVTAVCLVALGCTGSGADDALPPAPPKVTIIPSGDTTPIGGPTTTTTTIPPTTTSLPGSRPYTVQAGDTMSSIADRNGTTLAELLTLNPLKDPGALSVGQVLVLPPLPTTTTTAPGTAPAGDAGASPGNATNGATTTTTGTTAPAASSNG